MNNLAHRFADIFFQPFPNEQPDVIAICRAACVAQNMNPDDLHIYEGWEPIPGYKGLVVPRGYEMPNWYYMLPLVRLSSSHV